MNENERPIKCPYCGCSILVREQDELRCDECDIIVAELEDGIWVYDEITMLS